MCAKLKLSFERPYVTKNENFEHSYLLRYKEEDNFFYFQDLYKYK